VGQIVSVDPTANVVLVKKAKVVDAAKILAYVNTIVIVVQIANAVQNF